MSYRDSYIEVNLDAIKHNIKRFIEHTNKAFFAVIKANGYGLGDVEIANVANDCGAKYLAVSSLDEAISLREKGINQAILVLGYVKGEYIKKAKANDITLTATSLSWVKAVYKECTGVKIHLKINTGMNRLGLNDIQEVNEAITLLKDADIEGIYTHYACSDDNTNPLNQKQYDRFTSIVKESSFVFKYIHSSNSDAACKFEDELTNAIRVGLGMVGYSSYDIGLIPSVSLKSNVVNCHLVKKGETVSYGATFKAEKDSWIITLPIGYADGWIRKNQGRKVYIEEEYGEIVGKVCMDQMMVKVSKYYPLDSVVELFGEHISILDVAKDLDTIPYEILTLLSDRLTKKYYKSQKLIEVKAHRFER